MLTGAYVTNASYEGVECYKGNKRKNMPRTRSFDSSYP
jgi:hypothetical protein